MKHISVIMLGIAAVVLVGCSATLDSGTNTCLVELTEGGEKLEAKGDLCALIIEKIKEASEVKTVEE